MHGADQALRTAVGGCNKAKDARTLARARQAVPRRRLVAWLRQLERDAKAAYGGQTASPQYKLLLPKSAAATLALPLSERYVAIKATVAALGGPDVPKVLLPAQNPAKVLMEMLDKGDSEVAAAQLALDHANAHLSTARTAWFAQYKSLHAALTQKFPLDPERVDSYFLQPNVKKPKKVLSGQAVVEAVPDAAA